MKKIKAHTLFFLAVPILLYFSFRWPNSAFDLQIHDTYFVIAYLHVGLILTILFAIFGLAYWYVWKMKWKKLKLFSWVHVFITLFYSLLFMSQSVPGMMAGVPRRYYVFSENAAVNFHENLRLLILSIVALFIVSQFLFIVNMGYAYFTRNKISTK